MRGDKPREAHALQPSQAPRRGHPVRLPQATADLVNRMLTARCGVGS